MKKRKGFTLIELMIVIAIITILAAVLVPNFMRAREASRYSACKSNLKNISTGVEMYSNDYNGIYPASGTNGTNDGSLGNIGSKTNSFNQQYLGAKDIKCPTAGNTQYGYIIKSGTRYSIYCPAAPNCPQATTTRLHTLRDNSTGGPVLDSQSSYMINTANNAWTPE